MLGLTALGRDPVPATSARAGNCAIARKRIFRCPSKTPSDSRSPSIQLGEDIPRNRIFFKCLTVDPETHVFQPR